MSNYGNFDYWNKRYENEEDSPYDWLFAYQDVADVIQNLLPDKDKSILMIGCGNAPFSPDMYNIGGYTDIVNIDLSDVVIKQQAAKFPEQTWKVMDAMNTDFNDQSFPIVIDKSLIDTLLCASQSKIKTTAMIKECHRVLQPGGRFITFSLHSPEEVLPSYSELGLDWKVTGFQIQSDRHNDTNNRKRSVAHTLIVCDKACIDGSFLHEHPLYIPKGVLSADDFKRLQDHADQVNFEYALEHAPMEFLCCALFHALHGQRATRNAKLKALEVYYSDFTLPRSTSKNNNHNDSADEAEEDSDNDGGGNENEVSSTTPVCDEKELAERVDYSLSDYLTEAEEDLHEALKTVGHRRKVSQATTLQ